MSLKSAGLTILSTLPTKKSTEFLSWLSLAVARQPLPNSSRPDLTSSVLPLMPGSMVFSKRSRIVRRTHQRKRHLQSWRRVKNLHHQRAGYSPLKRTSSKSFKLVAHPLKKRFAKCWKKWLAHLKLKPEVSCLILTLLTKLRNLAHGTTVSIITELCTVNSSLTLLSFLRLTMRPNNVQVIFSKTPLMEWLTLNGKETCALTARSLLMKTVKKLRKRKKLSLCGSHSLVLT